MWNLIVLLIELCSLQLTPRTHKRSSFNSSIIERLLGHCWAQQNWNQRILTAPWWLFAVLSQTCPPSTWMGSWYTGFPFFWLFMVNLHKAGLLQEKKKRASSSSSFNSVVTWPEKVDVFPVEENPSLLATGQNDDKALSSSSPSHHFPTALFKIRMLITT